MALDETSRFEIWRDFMREATDTHEVIDGLTKAELRAAFDAADDWVDANSASFNTAIPQPARTQLTAKQKAKLLAMVLYKRWGVSA